MAFCYQTGTATLTARAPGVRERVLPSLERVIPYARDFADAKCHGQGEAPKQQSNRRSQAGNLIGPDYPFLVRQ